MKPTMADIWLTLTPEDKTIILNYVNTRYAFGKRTPVGLGTIALLTIDRVYNCFGGATMDLECACDLCKGVGLQKRNSIVEKLRTASERG